MAVDIESLRGFVGAGSGQNDILTACLSEADGLLSRYIEQHVDEDALGDKIPVPESVVDRATLEVAADLWHRRNAPNGIVNQQFGGVGETVSTPIRISRDPLAPARPILAPWCAPMGFA